MLERRHIISDLDTLKKSSGAGAVEATAAISQIAETHEVALSADTCRRDYSGFPHARACARVRARTRMVWKECVCMCLHGGLIQTQAAVE